MSTQQALIIIIAAGRKKLKLPLFLLCGNYKNQNIM
jgi:hypothetical protein